MQINRERLHGSLRHDAPRGAAMVVTVCCNVGQYLFTRHASKCTVYESKLDLFLQTLRRHFPDVFDVPTVGGGDSRPKVFEHGCTSGSTFANSAKSSSLAQALYLKRERSRA
jgi:hypothetical protein